MKSSFLLFDIAILAYTFGVHKQLRGQEALYKKSSVNGTSERVGATCGKSGSQTLALEKRRVWGEEFVL